MKTIFMTHGIRQKRPRRGVIRVQDDSGAVDGNEFVFYHGGQRIGRVAYKARGNPAVRTHLVKAWVELEPGVSVEFGS